MGELFPKAHYKKIRAAGGGAAPIYQRKPRAAKRAREQRRHERIAFIYGQQREYEVYYNGAYDHCLDRLEEKLFAQRPYAYYNYRNV